MRTRWGAVLALALTLPACSIGGDDATVDTKPPAAAEGAVAGGELRVGIVRPATINPRVIDPSDSAAALVVRTMCDPLIGVDPVTKELRPALAKTWRVLGGGKSVQLELREGLKYSDGSALSAGDVAAGLARVVYPLTVSPSAPLLAQVSGWQDLRDDKKDYLAGVRAVSGDTVQIELSRADTQWVHALTLPFAIPLPREKALAPGFSARPVCAGPYTLAADYTGSENVIRLVRNKNYEGVRPSLTRSGAGWADTITFKIYASRKQAYAALKAGAVDAAQVSSQDVPLATRDRRQVLSVPTGRLEYVGLPRKKPFDDPLVKLALSAALDRTRLDQVSFDSTRVPALNLFPITLSEELLPEERALTCDGSVSGSVEAARQYLAQRKIDLSKVSVPFYFNPEFDNARMVSELARQWKAAFGLTVRPTPLTFEAMLARGRSAGGFDGLFRMTATAEFPDVAEFVLPLIERSGFGTTNFTGYDGEIISRRLEDDAMIATDARDQRNEYFGIGAALCTVPIVPVAWYQSHLAISDAVTVAGNEGVNPVAGLPELRELSVG